jgi:F0F1-type ATP synthase assembly protein I
MEEVQGSQEQAVENVNPRESLSGWELHPAAAKVLLGIQIGWLAAILVLPKEWGVIRGLAYGIGMFCSGLLASKSVAMWHRVVR